MEFAYIKQVLDGDISKFSYLIDIHKNMAYSIAFRILNNKEDAEEAVQDSFLKAYRALAKFRGESKFSTWLYKIVVNSSVSRLKGRRIESNYMEIDDVPELMIDYVESVYRNLDKEDQRKYINRALEELEAEDSLILTLYYLNENTIGEIAEITSIPPKNLKMKIHRARKKMVLVLTRIFKNDI